MEPPEPGRKSSPAVSGRRWAGRLGGVLAAAALLWVVGPIFRHGGELVESVDGPRVVVNLVGGAILYAFVSVPLAVAWWWLSGLYGQRVSFRDGFSIFARSQLAKYAPGNAFHFVGRHLLGHRAGYGHLALVASSVLEMASLSLAAAAVAGGSYLWSRGQGAASVVLLAAVVGAVGASAWPLLDRLLRSRRWLERWTAGTPPVRLRTAAGLLGPAVGLHAAFFLASGALLLSLTAAVHGTGASQPTVVIGAFALAWAAGTLTLGAPAGVGVREAVLTLQLTPQVGPTSAAAIALGLRLLTTLGDLLTAIAGWWLRDRVPAEEGPAQRRV